MDSGESKIIKLKEESREEITDDDGGGEQMDALFLNGTVKFKNEVKTEQCDEVFANEIDDNTKYLCELCKSYFPSLTSLQDHMQSHDSCDEKLDIKSSNVSVNCEETINTEVKEASIERNHREKPDDKQEEKCNEKKTKRKRKYTEEEDDKENDLNENDEHELVNLITKDHIILGEKHHDGKVDKASVKIVKEETDDINKTDYDELEHLIIKDHVILRTHHHYENIIKMKTEATEEILRNPVCEKSSVHAETSDGNNQIDNGLSEARHDTNNNGNKKYASKDSNNRKRKKKLVSKELATENIPSQTQNMPNDFECNLCNKSFETSKKLKRHKYDFHIRGPVFCDVCQKKFSRKDDLNRHVEQVHLKINETENMPLSNQELDCNLCSKSFETNRKLRVHRYNSHGPSVFCDVCQKKFSRKAHLEKHVKGVHLGIKYDSHSIGPVFCDVCQKKFTRKDLLIRHVKRVHLKLSEKIASPYQKYDCNLCDKSYETNNKLKTHFSNIHKRPVFCDICKKKFSRKAYLEKHMKQVHLKINETENMPPPNQDLDCNLCSKSFETNRKLQVHKYNYHGPSAFCEVCQKKFSNKGKLDQHVKRVHLGIKEECECEFCGKSYATRWYMHRHAKKCSEKYNKKDIIEKTKCELCRNKYVSQKMLEMHMADHPRFICDYCEKVYYARYNLEMHIKRIHLKVRYRCNKCGKKFAKLYEHMQLCNKNIPPQSLHMPNNFDCNICSKSYNTSRQLANHKYSHVRKRLPVFCDVCQKQFSRRGNLNVHVKRVHLGDKVESGV